MLGGLITIAGGTIASSGLIIARRPNARQLIDMLTPYQGIIGAIMFVWGVYGTIDPILHLSYIAHSPILWAFWLASGIADLTVGFLLGFGLITKYALSRNPAALQRGQQIREKLTPYQGGLGLFAIVMGVLYLVWLYVL